MTKHAKNAANAIIRNLSDRGGFDAWWDDIDAETKREISDDIAGLVQAAIDSVSGEP